MRVLIIANARYNGGISGSDAIYENFKKYWDCSIRVVDMLDVDFKPFVLCYLKRIILSIVRAVIDKNRYDFVYSSSDFLPDSLAGFVYKIKGNKWVAGLYLDAFKDNKFHYYSQRIVKFLMDKFADMVIVTNPTMYHLFPNKKKTWINGGVDLSLAGMSEEEKKYDVVFCGRIHPSKGIDEMIDIWDIVRQKKPNAKLAIIGDGDLGKDYIKHKLFHRYGYANYNGIDILGYMAEERYRVFKKSLMAIYPTPEKYDHFSMAPVEAMACGCPLITFNTPIVKWFKDNMGLPTVDESIDYDDKKWDDLCLDSYIWAQQFDYQRQALRVFEDIKKEIF